MSVRKIIQMGHPTLHQVARPIDLADISTAEFRLLLNDMIDTLHDYGGVGLAAPQINEPVRLAIIKLPGGPSRYGELPSFPLTVFINPEVSVEDPTPSGVWEGCLSVPGLRGYVERPSGIRVSATNTEGERVTMKFEGFLATVLQHEFDHLEGKLYLERVTDMKKLMFEQEYLRHHATAEN